MSSSARSALIVARHLRDFERKLKARAPSAIRKSVNRRFQDPEGPIDYTAEAAAFSANFLTANFFKALRALNQAQPPSTYRVVDIGAGSGASAVAALVYLTTLQSPPPTIELVLIDRSPEQLQLAEEVLSLVRKILDRVDVSWRFVTSEATNTSFHLQDRGGLTIASHLFTENGTNVAPLLETILSVTSPGGTALIVERADDPVLTHVKTEARRKALNAEVYEGVALSPGEDVPHRPWNVGWISLPLPSREWLRYLVELYFKAWNEQRTDWLAEIFALDASYYEKPFGPRLIGLREIEDYWRDHVERQIEPTVKLLAVGYSDNVALAEWRARFRSGGQLFEIAGAIVFESDPVVRKIAVLREYFRANRTG